MLDFVEYLLETLGEGLREPFNTVYGAVSSGREERVSGGKMHAVRR